MLAAFLRPRLDNPNGNLYIKTMATRETEGAAVKEILRRELPRLRAEFGVKRLGLFGSFARICPGKKWPG